MFDEIAAAHGDNSFAIVDADNAPDVFQFVGVQGVPTTILYFNGVKVDEVMGCDPVRVRELIVAHHTRQKKLSAHSTADAPKARSALDGPLGPAAVAAAKPSVLVNTEYRKRKRDGGSDSEDEPEDTEEDFWAALEEACGELGYSLQQLRDMLADGDHFPPENLMEIVLRKVKTKNPGKVKGMLSKQRPGVLAKVDRALAEEQKQKTEEERKTMSRVQAIGKCPMGFDWHKEGGGWRCGGGSHYVSDLELQAYMVQTDECV